MEDAIFRIARAGLHFYEEPCISGSGGSGTIFFSGCDLRCIFCQNYEISRGGKGLNVNGEQLAFLMRYLVDNGADNINLVTPSVWTDRLIPLLNYIKPLVKVPIVWNSSGYEDAARLKKLEGLIDVYLPDFKYSDDKLAQSWSRAPEYFAKAAAAIREMRRQRPDDVFDKNGMMKEGVIVRHLVLPGRIDNTRGVLKAIASIDKTMFVSLMSQYFPTPAAASHPTLGRRVTESEYGEAAEAFFECGLENGFSQEPDSAVEDYVPSFDIAELEEILKKA